MGFKQSQIVKNTTYLYLRMVFSMFVAFYTSRVLLETLGVENYGVYNVVGGVVTFFSFLNSAMTSATQRFFSFELGRKDYKRLKQTFNATINIHIVIAFIIFFLAETIGLWFVNTKLVFEESLTTTVQYIYHFSVITFVVGIIKVPYNALIVAHEKMIAYAYLSIVEVFLKLLIVYLLIVIDFNKLILYSILYFLVTILIVFTYILYCYNSFKECKYEFYYDIKLYKTLISYSGWNLFGNVSSIAKGQGVNILLNLFFGTVLNAAYGIMVQVQMAVNLFVNNFQLAMNPQIIKTYALNKEDETINLIFKSSKYSFFLILIIILPIVFNINIILSYWLTIIPDYTRIFIVLCLINLLIDSMSGGIMTGIQATGNIKNYQIVVGILIFLNLPISYVGMKFSNMPEIFLYVSIIISIIAFVFRLFFLRRTIYFSIKNYFKQVLSKNLLVLFVALILCCLISNVELFTIEGNDFFSLIIELILMFISISLVLIYIGMNRQERDYLVGLIKKYKNR